MLPAEDADPSVATRQPVVRVEHLTKTYAKSAFDGAEAGRRHAVRDVSFDVARGETLGLVGRSGSGKTTIGRAALRLVEPTEGSVTITPRSGRAVDVMRLGPRDLRTFRRQIQMIFQDPYESLNPRRTVRDIIEEPLRVHNVVASGDIADRVQRLLDQVGLDRSVLGDHPTTLSGGQRQRVGIARAIATEPCFIVADEPVTALDVSVQAQILNLLKDLRDLLGLSYLLISHDLAVVEHMADRVAVLANGRIVEIGKTDEVLRAPRHPVTAELVDAAREGRA